MSTLYSATYHGPTNFRGSRFTVANLMTGERRTVPYDYSADNAPRAAVESVVGAPVEFCGEDSRRRFFTTR